jgi:hypothetical protein
MSSFQPKSYEFGYSVKDAQSGNDYDRHESSDGNVVRGEYRVQLPDGRTQIGEFLNIIIIFISLLISPLLGHRPSLWITHKENGL